MITFEPLVKSSQTATTLRRHAFILAWFFMLLFIQEGFGQMIIFHEDWSNGIGNWGVSNGLWEVGNLVPGVGPDSCYSPTRCAGTILGGNYPHGSNSRLESPVVPAISLPSLGDDERIQLKFWSWFRNSNDVGSVQISVNSGPWIAIPGPILTPSFTGASPVWTQYIADLSAYADSTIRIGFQFASGSTGSDLGWYIDDILIEKEKVVWGTIYTEDPVTKDCLALENFENGVDSWSADNGLWEVGIPIPPFGPDSCHSTPNCAGTILSGNYPHEKRGRFISPAITLKPKSNKTMVLYFWHWFRLSNDVGFVEISVNDGPWERLHNSPFTGASPGWTQAGGYILSTYADSLVRIGFFFSSNSTGSDHGWYIDDIRIVNVENPTSVEARNSQPSGFALHQNHPNPFNPSTTILYELPHAGDIEIVVFDLLGERVRTLLNHRQAAGQHRLQWDGRDDRGKVMPSGAYLYRLRAGDFVQTRKMILMQ